jgi:hypothetical protein
MRSAIAVLAILLLTSAAIAQGKGSHGTGSGVRAPVGDRMTPGTGINDATLPTDLGTSEPRAVESLDIPSAAGGGGSPPEHTHAGHGHPHCEEKQVCQPNRWVDWHGYYNGQLINGYLEKGPCWMQKVC